MNLSKTLHQFLCYALSLSMALPTWARASENLIGEVFQPRDFEPRSLITQANCSYREGDTKSEFYRVDKINPLDFQVLVCRIQLFYSFWLKPTHPLNKTWAQNFKDEDQNKPLVENPGENPLVDQFAEDIIHNMAASPRDTINALLVALIESYQNELELLEANLMLLEKVITVDVEASAQEEGRFKQVAKALLGEGDVVPFSSRGDNGSIPKMAKKEASESQAVTQVNRWFQVTGTVLVLIWLLKTPKVIKDIRSGSYIPKSRLRSWIFRRFKPLRGYEPPVKQQTLRGAETARLSRASLMNFLRKDRRDLLLASGVGALAAAKSTLDSMGRENLIQPLPYILGAQSEMLCQLSLGIESLSKEVESNAVLTLAQKEEAYDHKLLIDHFYATNERTQNDRNRAPFFLDLKSSEEFVRRELPTAKKYTSLLKSNHLGDEISAERFEQAWSCDINFMKIMEKFSLITKAFPEALPQHLVPPSHETEEPPQEEDPAPEFEVLPPPQEVAP